MSGESNLDTLTRSWRRGFPIFRPDPQNSHFPSKNPRNSYRHHLGQFRAGGRVVLLENKQILLPNLSLQATCMRAVNRQPWFRAKACRDRCPTLRNNSNINVKLPAQMRKSPTNYPNPQIISRNLTVFAHRSCCCGVRRHARGARNDASNRGIQNLTK